MTVNGERPWRRGRVSALVCAAATVAAGAVFSPAAIADPSVTYILSPNDDGHGNDAAGQFAIYAIDSTADGNQGIAGFSIDVQGFSTISNVAPQAFYPTPGGTLSEGFTFSRTADNIDPLHAAQDTITTNRALVNLVYGLGRTAGNLDAIAPNGGAGGTGKVQPVYDAKLLIATGTFTDPALLSWVPGKLNDHANVFLTNTGAFTTLVSSSNIATVTTTTVSYVGPTGSWSNAANWLPQALRTDPLPQFSDNVLITGTSGGAVTVTYDASAAAAPALNRVTIDGTASSPRTLAQTDNTLTTTREYVGVDGVGTLAISGGTHNVTGAGANGLYVGLNAGSMGNISLGGSGTLNITGNLALGVSGAGTLNQSGGAAVISGALAVGSTGAYTFSGGSLNATSTVNNGSFAQTGGPASLGAVTGAGSLSVATGTLSVTSFAQNAVTVGDGGKLQFAQGTTVTTNTAGLLTLSGSGTIDLANNRLLTTNTPLSQVRSYLLQARNGGSWTGIGGITSSTVQASPITLGMAYFSGANPANATLASVPGMTNPNAIFVRPAQIGDFNGDGVVDRFDIRQFNTRGAFNDGGTNHDWADGDLNNDGVVDRFDIRAFNTAGNFNNGVTFAAQPATLTAKASSAAPAVAPINTPTTVGLSGDGKPDLVYDPGTGDVVFKYDGFVPPASSPIVEMEIDSSKGSLRPNNASQTVAGSTTTSADGKLIDFANLGPTAIADGVDLGQIFPTGSNALLLTTGDISVSLFLYHDQTGSSYFADVVGGTAGVPEPTSLAFLGVAAAGLLGRRRRRQK